MSENETIKLRVRMREGEHVARGVHCELRLPERADGPIDLRLSSQTDRLGYPFEFSILGRIRGGDNHMSREVRAEHVFWKNGGGTTHWGPRLEEHVILGDPIDLTITDTHPRAGRGRSGRAHVTFWLTRNVLLRPSKVRKTSYTGRVTIKARRARQFTIKGVPLTFDHYYRYQAQNDGSSVTFREPVAAGIVRRLADVPSLLNPLEDFLLLAAVAARQRTICVGWEAVHPPVHVRHYRRGVSIPAERKDHGINDVLIEPQHLTQFFRRAHRTFATAAEQELLRQAVQRLVYDGADRVDLASSFIRFYGAIEALVLRHLRLRGGEHVLTAQRWRRTSEVIRRTIRTAPGLDSTEAALLIGKVPELNRITFAQGVRVCCDALGVNLSDLWPLLSDGAGPTLSTIRNRLVHGDTISDEEMPALMLAHEHLRWSAERLVLGALRWPVDRSRVRVGVPASIETADTNRARALLAVRWRRQTE